MASKLDLGKEEALQQSQQLLNMWLQTKGFLAKAFTDTAVTPEEEKAFLQTKSGVSQLTRTVSQKLPPDVKIGGERMQELMRQAISIGHLRSMPKSDKQAIIANWHAAFVDLARAVGCLQFISEGFIPTPKAARAARSGRVLDGGTVVTKKKQGNAKGWIKIILALGAIAGAVYYLMNR